MTPSSAKPTVGTLPEPITGATASAGAELRASRISQHGQVAVSFYQFDKDGSGYLEESEIGAFCKTLGLLLTDAEVSQALGEMEIDGTRDGKIDFDEFAAWWASGSRTKQIGSLAFRLQQAKEEAFQAEQSAGSPMGRMLSAKKTPAPAKSQGEEVRAPASAPSHERQTSPADAVQIDPSAKGGEDQERASSPVAVELAPEAVLQAELRARRQAEERRLENVQHENILETSRLFDDTATTWCSRSIIVVLVAAVVIFAFVILTTIWDASWEISEAGAILILCTVVFALLNFALVMCWWFDCSWMKGRRFVCMRNTDYPEPVKLHGDQP